MKAYLDNNVVSAIGTDDTPQESDALDRLLVAMDEGKIELVTSQLTLKEIQKCPEPWRKRHERTFRLLEKVPTVPWDRLYGMHSYGDAHTWINSPLIERDTLYTSFLSLGLEELDAQHVFVAVRTNCDVCLTCDGGVLNLAEQIRKLAPITVQKPSVFVANQGLL